MSLTSMLEIKRIEDPEFEKVYHLNGYEINIDGTLALTLESYPDLYSVYWKNSENVSIKYWFYLLDDI